MLEKQAPKDEKIFQAAYSSLLELICQQEALRPHHIAIRLRGKELSYGELSSKSRAVAAYLRDSGIGRGSLVAISLERSPDLIVAILGILRCGAACLPVDITSPAMRTKFMIEDSEAQWLLARHSSAARDIGVQQLRFEDAVAWNGVSSNMFVSNSDLAYVLYTSGSTGTPKGVAVEHGSLARLISWQNTVDGELSELGSMTTSQFASISFDVAFQEILSTLCSGRTLVLVDEDSRRDPRSLLDFLEAESIVRLFLPTAALHPLAVAAGERILPSLRRLYVAGEQLTITLPIRKWFSKMSRCQLHNQYGPTETHVVTSFRLSGEPQLWPTLPPIGAPLPHVTVHLLDQQLRHVVPGKVGEIYLGGQCLARGYFNRPSLTAERFGASDALGERLYRTGDLGQEKDGWLEYRGRKDRQVKISGYRVEPGEVEAQLAQHPEIAEVAVVADEDATGRKRLVAYFVPQKPRNGATTRRESAAPWRKLFNQRLPEFMVPTVWISTLRLPKTLSGKIDHASLPPVSSEFELSGRKPRNQTEQKIAELWCETLQLSEVGVEENFFDLGGTSLLLVHLQNMLDRRLALDFPVVKLVEHPTVRRMAAWVETGEARGEPTEPRLQPRSHSHCQPRRARKAEGEGVAVVGLSCRFPGADTPGRFWDNLCLGVESITFFDRPAAEGHFVAAAGVLNDIELFDAGLFGYSAREAALLDPQHRLFLECCWEALEDAGIEPSRCLGGIGVFGGSGPSTYLLNNLHAAVDWRPDRCLIDSTSELQLLVANDKDFLTSRISYKLDLHGPSVNLNAACATSLFAIHYAVRALLARDCELALAGAASVPVPQLAGYEHEPGMVFSPDGHCRAFDEQAAGTVFGSGVGVVALKRLEDALADGDSIYAVVRGSAINNDGGVKPGMTAPSVEGQARVIAEALRAAAIDPETINYVEAHGTGTVLGDPVEVAALTRAFGSQRLGSCALGSVKTNLGHLGWAAGIAGFIKTVLALHHREIPATLHFSQPNPSLDLARTPFFVNAERLSWKADGVRRAGVSAFGLGGVNAHVIVEESPSVQAPQPTDRKWHIIPLSAHSESSLQALAERLRKHIDAELPSLRLADIAATIAFGRRQLRIRRALVADSCEALSISLRKFAVQRPLLPAPIRKHRRICGLFTGQGAEYPGMGRELYEKHAVFRRRIDAATKILSESSSIFPVKSLYTDVEGDQLTEIGRIQPLVFTLQIALVDLWRSWGVEFDIVLGHSLGEFAAACTAGVFTFEDGLRLVAERGRLLQSLSDDASMVSVWANEADTLEALDGLSAEFAVAAVNSSSNTTISGTVAAIQEAIERLRSCGLEFRKLNIMRAGHSALMDPILDQFEAAASRILMHAPQIDFISNVTGKIIGDEVMTPRYWRRHLRETVRFATGLETLGSCGVSAVIDIGATPLLLGLAQQVLCDNDDIQWLASLRPGEDGCYTMASSLAELWSNGFETDWRAVQDSAGRRVHLPTYPFDRQRYWIDAPTEGSARRPSQLPRVDEIAYSLDWVAVPDAAGTTCHHDLMGHEFLLLNDDHGIGSALADALEQRGASCWVSQCGRPEGIADWQCSTRNVAAAETACLRETIMGRNLKAIVHLRTQGTPEPKPLADGASILESLKEGLSSGLALIQLVVATSSPPRLIFVTRGAQRVKKSDRRLAPSQAPIWGLARVCDLEHPELTCTRIDMDPDSRVDITALADLVGSPASELELARRGREWYRPRLARTSFTSTVTDLDSNSTYLVVGGLGGLGLYSASHLVDRGACHLILAGRSSPRKVATNTIAALRDRGVEVKVRQVDVTDHQQVDDLFAEIAVGRHPLRGILHCAGIIDDGMLIDLDWSRLAPALAPKAQGVWNLRRSAIKTHLKLDFFILYSSATSLLGNAAQANHAAACAFLDTFAHAEQNCLAVNWGAWSDIGYLKAHPEIQSDLQRRGMGTISPRTGGLFLEQCFNTPRAQLAAFPNAWKDYLRHQPVRASLLEGLGVELEQEDPDTRFRVRLLRSDDKSRRRLLEAHLTTKARELLGTGSSDNAPSIDRDEPLVNHGMDSLVAIRLRNAIQKSLDCRLGPRVVFENSTIGRFADHLLTSVLNDDWYQQVVNRHEKVVARSAEETAEAKAEQHQLSIQQQRWLRLIRDVGYGQRVVPILIHAELHRAALHEALRLVIGRHELLTYRFPQHRPEVMSVDSVLGAESQLFVDLTHEEPIRRAALIRGQVHRCYQRLGDPAVMPSWTLRCLKLSPDLFVLLLGLQHLEFDGTSLSVFVDEICRTYRALVEGRRPELEPPVQYREFVERLEVYMRNDLETDRSFFTGLFASLKSTTALPGHAGFDQTRAFPARRWTPETPLASWEQVLKAAQHLQVSVFSLLMATYARLVAEITESPESVIGMITSARNDARFAATIGPFTTPVPVPVAVAGRSLAELAAQCHRTVGHLTARSYYPSPDLANVAPAFAGFPIDTYFTDTCINFLNYRRRERGSEPRAEILEILGPVKHLDFDDQDFSQLRRIPGLHLVVDVWRGGLRANYWYHLHRFPEDLVAQWARRHHGIMQECLDATLIQP